MLIQFFVIIVTCLIISVQCAQIKSSSEELPTCKNGVELNLSNAGLRQINKNILSSSIFTCLNLQNNKISRIEDNSLDNLKNLRYLNLAGNKLLYNSFSNISSSSLETLVLDQALTSLTESEINEQKNCQNTDVNLHHPRNIEVSLSIKFPRLENLFLRRNNITRMYADSWRDNMPSVKRLYLSHNELTGVEFLKCMPSTLTHLFLNNNKINRFVSGSLENLEELDMDSNNISILCGAANPCKLGASLKNANRLKKLSLSYVGLERIDSDALDDLINIIELDLSHNKIRTIANCTFDNSTNLNSLELQNNELTVIPDFCSLINLKILVLNYNLISRIDNFFNCKTINLKILSLSHNKLKTIPPGVFDGLSSLQELYLSGNKIEVLPDDWIGQEINLRHLHLDDNLFDSISDMSLDNCTKLESIDIAGNPLKTLSRKSLMILPENTIIDLEKINRHSESGGGRCHCDFY